MKITGPYFDRRTSQWTLTVTYGRTGHLVDFLTYQDEKAALEGRARIEEQGDIVRERNRTDVVQG